MKIVGIIAEFNPMHNGHKYLLQKAKELTRADLAICIISGNFTQAGNVAIQDKFIRSKIAIENGFDAVIELPTIYATSSAEFFSFGAVNILNNLNCIDYLCLGSETGNIDELKVIAKKLLENNDNMWENITESLREGISFAKAREYAISKFLTKEEIHISTQSNNILAIEYIKSLLKLKSNIIPLSIKREESASITSATKIREMISNNISNKDVANFVLSPNTVLNNPKLNNNIYSLVKYEIISKGKDYLKNINEVTEGLENKLIEELNNSNNYNEFIQNIKSKRYQLSKIKRILINILLGITKEAFITLNTNRCSYAHILAVNDNVKRTLLSILNKNSKIPIISSLSDEKISLLDNVNKTSIQLDIKASNIYSIISNDKINKDYTNKL